MTGDQAVPRTGADDDQGTPCLHERIVTFRNGTVRLWACEECRRRFYPACYVCIKDGHRNIDHPGVWPRAIDTDDGGYAAHLTPGEIVAGPERRTEAMPGADRDYRHLGTQDAIAAAIDDVRREVDDAPATDEPLPGARLRADREGSGA